MVLRVRLRVKVENKTEELIVLANGGAESQEPVLAVDEKTAERLGLWPTNEAEIFEVEEASTTTYAYLLPSKVELELLDEDEIVSRIEARLVIEEGLTEPLITDITIDNLGIQILSFSKGLWKHVNDPPEKIRKGV